MCEVSSLAPVAPPPTSPRLRSTRRRLRLLHVLALAVILMALLVAVVDAAGRDFYKILGVRKDANDRQLKKAYHKLSRKYHPSVTRSQRAVLTAWTRHDALQWELLFPCRHVADPSPFLFSWSLCSLLCSDKNDAPDAEQKFVEISHAYEVLSEKKTRDIYDQFGEEGLKQGGGGGGGGPQQGGQQGFPGGFHQGGGGGGGGASFQFSDPMNLFAQFFGGGGGMGDMGGMGGMGGGQRMGRQRGGQGMGGMGTGMPGMGGGGPGFGGSGGGGSSGPSKVISLSSAAPGPLKPSSDKRGKKLSNETWLVEYMSPGCGHCQRLQPEYAKAAAALAGLIKVAAVDCTQSQDLCNAAGIKGYPTIKVLRGGSHAKPEEYRGERTAKAIYDFAVNLIPATHVTHIMPTTSKGLTSFLAAAAADRKPAVVFVTNKLSPQYKLLAKTYAAHLKCGVAVVTDAKRAEMMKAIGAPSDAKQALVILHTDDAGRETSREVYKGAMKMKALDAFLYQHAKKAKKMKSQRTKAGKDEL